jgi:NlpC/P60 family putative phage cell wall peptidase
VTQPSDWRARVVTEARTWVGTRYHHQADVRGHGVDCAMLLVRVYCDLGLAPPFDPRPYSPQWYLHHTEEKYLGWIERYCHRVAEAAPGDIAMYRFGRAAAHGAIVVDELYMIHAYEPEGCVRLTERSQPFVRGRFDSYWSLT